jgi:hypothetical protein
MRGLPKIVLERLKRKPIGNERNCQSAIEDRQFSQVLEHPDANFLAAFVEKTLTARERTQVLNHLAQCAECRALAALSLPGEVEVAQRVSLTARRWWRAGPTLRWGALAAALGAAAIVMVLHSYPWRKLKITAQPAGAETKQRVTLMAAARPPVAVEAKNIPSAPRAREISSGKSAASAGPLLSPPAPAKPAFKPSVAPEDTLKTESGAEPQAGETAMPAKAESAAASQELNAAQAGGTSAPSSTRSAPRAAASIRVGARLVEPSRMAFGANFNRAVAPLPALWSISTSGKVQRSQDSGRTWEEVRVDDAVTFRVVHAAGRDVWAGGSGAALYHSSDGGAMWKRVNLSSGASPTTETIVAITSGSRNLQQIMVRTGSGEQWITDDGGQRWQREP